MLSVLTMSITTGKDIHVESMDAEAIAVIKKNSKNNNIKRCVKVTGEVTVAHPFVKCCYQLEEGLQWEMPQKK